jgi:hypothetical protein
METASPNQEWDCTFDPDRFPLPENPAFWPRPATPQEREQFALYGGSPHKVETFTWMREETIVAHRNHGLATISPDRRDTIRRLALPEL